MAEKVAVIEGQVDMYLAAWLQRCPGKVITEEKVNDLRRRLKEDLNLKEIPKPKNVRAILRKLRKNQVVEA